jgi:hypothetical protein
MITERKNCRYLERILQIGEDDSTLFDLDCLLYFVMENDMYTPELQTYSEVFETALKLLPVPNAGFPLDAFRACMKFARKAYIMYRKELWSITNVGERIPTSCIHWAIKHSQEEV